MLKRLARFILWAGGWTAVGDWTADGGIPDTPKAVLIAAPHTSNWDGFWALTYTVAVGADIRFFAKQSLFWFPLSAILRSLGCVPLDRSKATSAVAQAAAMFDKEDTFYFGLAPEGTRAYRDVWKSGFYRIALAAGVPVGLGFLDYAKKRVGIIDCIDLSGDAEADLAKISDAYRDIVGRHPERMAPIRFAE